MSLLASPICSLHKLSRSWTGRGRGVSTPYILLPNSMLGFKNATESASLSHTNKKKKGDVLHFVKYHGIGNDFILVDNRDSLEPQICADQAMKLCSRNFGVGADGVIFTMPGVDGTDYSMRIFNSDGSEPEMCGNGIRCMARFVAELENSDVPRSYTIHTGAGLIVPNIQADGKVIVDMGQPILNAADIPTNLPGREDGAVVKSELLVDGKTWIVTCVSMGNPHCVTFSHKDCEALDVNSLHLEHLGPLFEHHEMFPARTNTGILNRALSIQNASIEQPYDLLTLIFEHIEHTTCLLQLWFRNLIEQSTLLQKGTIQVLSLYRFSPLDICECGFGSVVQEQHWPVGLEPVLLLLQQFWKVVQKGNAWLICLEVSWRLNGMKKITMYT